MKLYYTPGACSLAPHIALAESGLGYTLDKVDLKTHTVDGKDYYAVNPKGAVPALEMEDKDLLTENAVILGYIADKAGKLAPPAGSKPRLRLQEWVAYITTEVHKTLGALFNPALPEEARKIFIANGAKKLAHVSDKLGDRYLTGDEFTVADGYLYVMLRWAQFHKVDISDKLRAYFKRVEERAGVQRALKEEGLA
jgi:glutathione S-transferase